MEISKKGLKFLKSLEGCSLTSYLCPAGILTIGYGHTGVEVHADMGITEKEAEDFLLKDLEKFEEKISSLLKVEVKQREFDSMVCLAFNIGLKAFENSTVLKRINEKAKKKDIISAWILWDKITVNGEKQVSKGLMNRRFKEVAFYCGKL